jgi:hypothetical protein
MRKWAVLACLWAAVIVLSLGGLAGCATVRPADEGLSIERTLARAEYALAAAELALAMWDAQAVEHPEIDRWPEERVKLAEAVREARKVVEMLQALTTKNTESTDDIEATRGAHAGGVAGCLVVAGLARAGA